MPGDKSQKEVCSVKSSTIISREVRAVALVLATGGSLRLGWRRPQSDTSYAEYCRRFTVSQGDSLKQLELEDVLAPINPLSKSRHFPDCLPVRSRGKQGTHNLPKKYSTSALWFKSVLRTDVGNNLCVLVPCMHRQPVRKAPQLWERNIVANTSSSNQAVHKSPWLIDWLSELRAVIKIGEWGKGSCPRY